MNTDADGNLAVAFVVDRIIVLDENVDLEEIYNRFHSKSNRMNPVVLDANFGPCSVPVNNN